jgi:hypothetical protein
MQFWIISMKIMVKWEETGPLLYCRPDVATGWLSETRKSLSMDYPEQAETLLVQIQRLWGAKCMESVSFVVT